MNFGGPVWHASGRGETEAAAFALARRALNGVGDAQLGQWIESGNRGVVHIRRRLTPREAPLVNALRDIRGTDEESERLAALVCAAPHLAPLFNIRPAWQSHVGQHKKVR